MNIRTIEKYKFNKNLISRNIGEVMMVYNPDAGETMEINDVGAEIYCMLKEEKSIATILETLAVNYQEDIKNIESDVEVFIERMIVLGVIILED